MAGSPMRTGTMSKSSPKRGSPGAGGTSFYGSPTKAEPKVSQQSWRLASQNVRKSVVAHGKAATTPGGTHRIATAFEPQVSPSKQNAASPSISIAAGSRRGSASKQHGSTAGSVQGSMHATPTNSRPNSRAASNSGGDGQRQSVAGGSRRASRAGSEDSLELFYPKEKPPPKTDMQKSNQVGDLLSPDKSKPVFASKYRDDFIYQPTEARQQIQHVDVMEPILFPKDNPMLGLPKNEPGLRRYALKPQITNTYKQFQQ